MNQTYADRNPFRVISKIGTAQDDVLSFPSANAALSYAKRMAKNREWHLVRFEKLVHGQFVEQLDMMSTFLETSKARPTRVTHISATPHLYKLGQAAKDLELIAVRGSVDLTQSMELIRLASVCGQHCGLNRSHIEAVLDDVFGPSSSPANNATIVMNTTFPMQSSTAKTPFEAIEEAYRKESADVPSEVKEVAKPATAPATKFNPFAKR